MRDKVKKLFSGAEELEKLSAFSFLTLLLLRCGYFNTLAYSFVLTLSLPLLILLALSGFAALFFRSYTKKELYLTVGVIALAGIVYAATNEIFPPLTLLAMIVLKNCGTEEMLKWYLMIKAVLFTVLFVLTSLGLLENRVRTISKSGMYTVTVFSYGATQPNQIGLFFATAAFALLCVLEKKNYNLKLLLILLASFFAFAATQSRAMLMTVLLTLICAFLMQFEPCEKAGVRVLEKTCLIMIALFLFIGIAGPYLYLSDSKAIHTFIDPINKLMNGRLRHSSKLLTAGLSPSLFGIDRHLANVSGGTPIDSGYTNILYRCGMAFTAVSVAAYAWACRYYAKKKPMYSVCILVTMFYGLFENIFIRPMLNVPMLLTAGALMKWWDEPPTVTPSAILNRLRK